jgi:hypothetical protein
VELGTSRRHADGLTGVAAELGAVVSGCEEQSQNTSDRRQASPAVAFNHLA